MTAWLYRAAHQKLYKCKAVLLKNRKCSAKSFSWMNEGGKRRWLLWFQVKTAASCALGSMAVGSLNDYLPFLLKEISSQPRRQYLLLHSLKEVIRCVFVGFCVYLSVFLISRFLFEYIFSPPLLSVACSPHIFLNSLGTSHFDAFKWQQKKNVKLYRRLWIIIKPQVSFAYCAAGTEVE